MLILAYFFIFLAVSLIAIGLVGVRETSSRPIQFTAESYRSQANKRRAGIPLALPGTRILLEKINLAAKIRMRLDAARIKMRAEDFFTIKLITTVLFTFLAYYITHKSLSPWVVIGFALGYVAPDIWINRMIAQRKNQIVRLLPETVDLLGLCVEAGLDFTSAIQWIVKKKIFKNPMVEELEFVSEEITWGKPRAQALKDMARRLDVPEIRSFVYTMVQAEKMGTPVAEAFGILSEDIRLQRLRRGERFAAQAPIKILLPLVFCILPVIAIVVGGPIMLQFMQGGVFSGFSK